MQNKTTRREQEHIQNKKYTERTGKKKLHGENRKTYKNKTYMERTGKHTK